MGEAPSALGGDALHGRGTVLGEPRSMVAAVNSLNSALTTLDWIIIAFTVLMAVWGYGQGLIAGGLSLVGFAAGAFIGSRLGPLLLEDGSHSPYAPLSALLGAVLIGGLFASGFELLGFHLRRRMGERIGLLDGVGGARAGGLPRAVPRLDRRSGGAADAGRARAARADPALRDPQGAERRSCRRRARSFRRWRASTRSRRSPGRPQTCRRRTRRSRATPTWRQARRSVVRVLGTACGLGVQGSGWVAGTGSRGHERPRGGGAGRHDRAGRRRGPGARRGGDLVRPAQRPLDPARARALRRAGAAR